MFIFEGINTEIYPVSLLIFPIIIFLLSFFKNKSMYYILLFNIFFSFFYSIAYVTFPLAYTVPYMQGVCLFFDNYFLSIQYGFEMSMFILALPKLFIIVLLHGVMLYTLLKTKVRNQYQIENNINIFLMNILAYVAFLIICIFIYVYQN